MPSVEVTSRQRSFLAAALRRGPDPSLPERLQRAQCEALESMIGELDAQIADPGHDAPGCHGDAS